MCPSIPHLRLYSATDLGMPPRLGVAERGLHAQIMRLVDPFGRVIGALPKTLVRHLGDALARDEKDRRALRRRLQRLREVGEVAEVGNVVVLRSHFASQGLDLDLQSSGLPAALVRFLEMQCAEIAARLAERPWTMLPLDADFPPAHISLEARSLAMELLRVAGAPRSPVVKLHGVQPVVRVGRLVCTRAGDARMLATLLDELVAVGFVRIEDETLRVTQGSLRDVTTVDEEPIAAVEAEASGDVAREHQAFKDSDAQVEPPRYEELQRRLVEKREAWALNKLGPQN